MLQVLRFQHWLIVMDNINIVLAALGAKYEAVTEEDLRQMHQKAVGEMVLQVNLNELRKANGELEDLVKMSVQKIQELMNRNRIQEREIDRLRSFIEVVQAVVQNLHSISNS